jgi:beta-1,4-mannosyl-glycoprotein beta-1,4-N-acetylglucosaminyltransferase
LPFFEEAILSEATTFSVYDCFTFDGEECLDLRLKAHWDQVDIFVIVEANLTFSNLAKPYSFDPEKYAWAMPKIRYIQLDATEFSNCVTAWDREKFQRNAMQRGYVDSKSNDVIIISDVDEVIRPGLITEIEPNSIHIFQQLILYFYNNYLLVSDPYMAKVVAVRGDFAAKYTPDEIRNDLEIRQSLNSVFKADAGWHFSYLGGHKMIEHKLARFSHQNLNKPKYKNLEHNIQRINSGKDIYWRAKRWGRVDIPTFGSEAIDTWFKARPELTAPGEISFAGSVPEVVQESQKRSGLRKQLYKAKLRIWNFI